MRDLTLAWYDEALRRHQTVVWGLTLLGLVTGIGLAVLQTPVFHATAIVVATPQPPPGSGREGLRRAPTVDSDALLLASDRVLRRAAEDTAYPGGLLVLRENVDITARATSRVLRVRVTAPDAATAQTTANAVASEFLRVRSAADDTRFQSARDALEEQVTRLEGQLSARAQESAADSEVAALRNELRRLRRELVASRATLSASGFVAEPAPLPTAPIRPLAVATVVSVGLVGFAAGASVAVSRHHVGIRGESS